MIARTSVRSYGSWPLLLALASLGQAGMAAEMGLSATTVARTRTGGRMEVDGMLAMVRWLGVPVETFVRESKR